ncbi:MAG: (Fe-S)-binding protein, partial [Candidatus Thorarchaeota archaeon]
MSKENVNKEIITTGPTVSGIFSPDQKNLVRPLSKKEEDYERCLQCGYCRNVCRVYNSTFSERDYAGGRNRILKSLSKREVDFDKEQIIPAIYQCMLCGNCRVVCPVEIDTLEVFQSYRRTIVRKGVMPDKLRILRDSIRRNNNPFLESGSKRFDWCSADSCNEGHLAYERGVELTKKMELGDLKPKERQDHVVGYFIGCTSAYRNNELVSATCRILDKMGVEFIVFPDEKCCGSVLFRTGLEDDTIDLVKYNVNMIRKLGIDEVVFSCAGCFSTFTSEYPKLIGNLGFEVSHMVQFVPKIAKQKNLRIRYTKRTKDNPLMITYHDPCHLGRYCDVYDEPRELIEMIEGIKLVEMKHNRDMSWCCGAGGGVRALYGEISSKIANSRLDETISCWEEINENRLKEALETEAEAMVSACVFCKNNLQLAASETKADLPVIDLSQILEDCEFYE